jgi:hypothetical protein
MIATNTKEDTVRRFTTFEELHDNSFPLPVRKALEDSVRTEHEISHPKLYNPEAQGSVWLLEPTDIEI